MKRILQITAVFVIGMAGGIFSSQVLFPYFFEQSFLGLNSEHLTKLVSGPIYLTEKKEITVQENIALKYSIEKVEKSIVGIKAKTEDETLYGSGLILTSDGLVVALSDLVPKGADVVLFVDGKTPQFQILKRGNGLVLIKVQAQDLQASGFADFNELEAGERVFLLGKVFLNNDILTTVNEGIVKHFTQDYIRTNMSEKSLLSGSALFNIKGELLGLNTIDSENRVFAIPVNIIKEFAGF